MLGGEEAAAAAVQAMTRDVVERRLRTLGELARHVPRQLGQVAQDCTVCARDLKASLWTEPRLEKHIAHAHR